MNSTNVITLRLLNGMAKRRLTIQPVATLVTHQPSRSLRHCRPCGNDYGTFRTSCPTCGDVPKSERTLHWQKAMVAKHCPKKPQTSVGAVVIQTIR